MIPAKQSKAKFANRKNHRLMAVSIIKADEDKNKIIVTPIASDKLKVA